MPTYSKKLFKLIFINQLLTCQINAEASRVVMIYRYIESMYQLLCAKYEVIKQEI